MSEPESGGQPAPHPAAGQPEARTRGEIRREELLAVGRRLFAHRPYDELSIDEIAAVAGVAKGLLYYYFGSKRGFYVAVVEGAASELRAVAEPEDGAPPGERLVRTIDAYLHYVERYPEAYRTLIAGGVGSDAQVRAILERERAAFAELLIAGLTDESDGAPALRSALQGWMSFIEGVCLDWLAHRDLELDQLRRLLLEALAGAVAAARALDSELQLSLPTIAA
jgi:AcrR family transcriptional regulator